MTRAHKGHYRAKHPEGAKVPDQLSATVSENMRQGQLSCSVAFDIAGRLKLAPLEVGKAVDLQEGRLKACQLGLFGYGASDKRIQKANRVPEALGQEIDKALSGGRLQCVDAWRIADTHQLKRIEVARACESMNIRISHCQLGAF